VCCHVKRSLTTAILGGGRRGNHRLPSCGLATPLLSAEPVVALEKVVDRPTAPLAVLVADCSGQVRSRAGTSGDHSFVGTLYVIGNTVDRDLFGVILQLDLHHPPRLELDSTFRRDVDRFERLGVLAMRAARCTTSKTPNSLNSSLFPSPISAITPSRNSWMICLMMTRLVLVLSATRSTSTLLCYRVHDLSSMMKVLVICSIAPLDRPVGVQRGTRHGPVRSQVIIT